MATHLLPAAAIAVCSAVLAGAACGTSVSATSDDAGSTRHDAAGNETPDDASSPVEGPSKLSEAGLYTDFAARTVVPEAIAYTPRYEFWADGAKKSRWLILPPGTTIDDSEMDHWTFPIGTKVFKQFDVDGKPVETRLLMKVRDGGASGWWMAAYVWNADGSDALATPDGARDVLGTAHDVPSYVDCVNCHQNVRDVLVGVSAIQLGDPSKSPRPVDALASAGRLAVAPPADLDVPGDGVVKDALGYLHANCGQCHNGEAVRLATQTPMRLRLLVGQRTPESTGAYTTTFDTTMKHPLDGGVTSIIVKGSPDTSGLFLRMSSRDAYAMPPAGTELVDTEGAATVRSWIASLPP